MNEKNKIYIIGLALFAAFTAWVIPAQYFALNPTLANRYQLITILVLILISAVTFWYTENRKKFWQLIKEAKIEFLKVVWPTKSEYTTYFITVIIFSIIVAIYCYLIDKLVEWFLYIVILN